MDRVTGYLARAWADLTADEKWWQVILVLGLVNCVPVVGQIVTMGYLCDWAKEAAWGMRRPLPREIGDFKRRIKYGLIWLAVTLVWTVPVWIVGRLLGLIPAIGPVLHFLCALVLIVAAVVSSAAVLRGLIYERVLPGLQIDRMLKMAAKDVPGLARVFCIALISFLVAVAALILILIPAGPFMVSIMGFTTDGTFGMNVIPVLVLGILTIVVSLFVWFAATICQTVVMALYMRAMGCWLEQFHPDEWGSPHEQMPFEKAGDAPKEPAGTSTGEEGETPDSEGAGDSKGAGPSESADEPEESGDAKGPAPSESDEGEDGVD